MTASPAPVWAGPPPDVRPGVVALSVELARSDSTVVLVEGARAYPSGVVLRLVVMVPEPGGADGRYLFDQLDVTHGRGNLNVVAPQDGGLWWGFEFSDGSRVTTADDPPWTRVPEGVEPDRWTPDRPLFEALGRPARYAGQWSRELWLWPLPPPGPIRAECTWRDRRITESVVTFDAAEIREAVARCTALWR